MAVIFATSNADAMIGTVETYTGTAETRVAGYTTEEIRALHVSNTSAYVFKLPTLTHTSTVVWLHFRAKFPTDSNSSAADGYFLQFYGSSGNIIGGVSVIDGNLAAYVRPSSSDIAGAQFDQVPLTVYTIDVRVESTATLEKVDLYVNGTLVSTASGTPSANRGFPTGIFFHLSDFMGVSAGSGWGYYSEIIVDDATSTIGTRLCELTPASDGALTEFTGSYTDLLTKGDFAAILGDAGERFSWNPTAYGGPNAGETIRAVVGQAYATTGGTGPTGISQLVRIGGTNYFGASEVLGPGASLAALAAWQANPATAAAWTISDLGSMQVGVRADA